MRSAANGNGPTGGNSGPKPISLPHHFGHACTWCMLGITAPSA